MDFSYACSIWCRRIILSAELEGLERTLEEGRGGEVGKTIFEIWEYGFVSLSWFVSSLVSLV